MARRIRNRDKEYEYRIYVRDKDLLDKRKG